MSLQLGMTTTNGMNSRSSRGGSKNYKPSYFWRCDKSAKSTYFRKILIYVLLMERRENPFQMNRKVEELKFIFMKKSQELLGFSS